MSELVADCPRCGSKRMTFDLTQELSTKVEYSWQRWYEAFCVCRHCKRATIFTLSQNADADMSIVQNNGLLKLSGAVNRYMNVQGFINISNIGTIAPPEHLPKDIENAFNEG